MLRQLAEEEDASMQTILDKAVERYRRDKFVRDGGGRVGREDVERTVSKPTHDLNPPN